MSHEAIYQWVYAQPVATLRAELIVLRSGRTARRGPQPVVDRGADAGLRAGAQPGRGCVGEPEERAGQPRRPRRGQLAAVVKNRLKRVQDRPDRIDGFLAQTGLAFGAEPP